MDLKLNGRFHLVTLKVLLPAGIDSGSMIHDLVYFFPFPGV